MKKRSSLFTVLVFMGFGFLSAQNEGAIWFFGDNVGMDFRSGSPVELPGSPMSTLEGCATICDCNGNLLFYTDGSIVWDANHDTMPNGTGLKGHSSAIQSALITTMPGDPDKYYIFTADAGAYLDPPNDGIHYNIVDMTLNGGMGDVTTKNQQLLANATEKLTGVLHANQTNIWIIAHGWGDNAFYAWEVTPTGILPPVITNVGTPHTNLSGTDNETIGQMKCSPDGSKLALAVSRLGNFFEVFDFDNATGIPSNPVYKAYSFNPMSVNNQMYGLEFSPNSRFLYVGHYVIPGMGDVSQIFQFDLEAGTPADILASETEVLQSPFSGGVSSFQLAIDGKIYFTQAHNWICVIHNPNEKGLACNVQTNILNPVSGTPRFGLPTYIASLYNPVFDVGSADSCKGAPVNFTISDTSYITTTQWNFDDPGSGGSNTSTDMFPSHVFSNPGTYNVQLISNDKCGGMDTITYPIVVEDCGLPVEMLEFTGYNTENGNILQWTTASERNNDYFVLERSQNTIDFSQIAVLQGNGNSNTTKIYSAIDRNPYTAINYYRLKQVDFDGSFEYSQVITINSHPAGAAIRTYPNPAGDYLDLEINSNTYQTLHYVLIDASGSIVLTGNAEAETGINYIREDISSLQKGLCFLIVRDEQNRIISKSDVIIE